MRLWRPPLALFARCGHCLLGVGIVCSAWALFAMLGENGGVGEKGGVGEIGENFSVRAEPISEKKS